jgi:glycosyltransferase involved in cell wall biosynthesis/tetratricopeptide (TPR) repeat protein
MHEIASPIRNEVPLAAVPGHFAGMRQSPYLMEYLMQVLRLCPRGGVTLEVGVESAYGAIWLSQRGICASGISNNPLVVERARAVNNLLKGSAEFYLGDPFELYEKNAPRYHVIHSQGFFEHFTVPMIRAALAQQVASADAVVFSVPSVYYPFAPEFGDERLLPIELWEWILSPFDIVELAYYGDPRLGGQEHVRCVLRGQSVDEQLLALMSPGSAPYPNGITAIVHTRNEASRIAECLDTVRGWADEIIVCDMESTDATVEIARLYTDIVISHPLIENFDRARNVSSMRATRRWILFLDADERVPAGLAQALRHIADSGQDGFEGMLVPFRHHFAGHWLKFLYPGYTAPRFLRNGKFLFNPRLHSGAQVDGRVTAFPPENPDLALVHYSYDSLAHYLDKLNRYTDGESLNMHRDGEPFHWQRAVGHFVKDFQDYYERGKAIQDGPHGFIWSFNSAFYRYYQHAKLYERRYKEGKLLPFETAVPESMEQMLEYMLALCRQKPRAAMPSIHISAANDAGTVVWSGPLLDPSGYGEESRNMLLALASTAEGNVDVDAIRLSAQAVRWSDNEADLSEADTERLNELAARPASPGFVQILHNFPTLWERHPQAGFSIGRTTFETDRLPQDWVKACNKMDQVWVPSKFNVKTFADAGVDPEKLVVVPECINADLYRDLGRKIDTPKVVRDLKKLSGFKFLSVFDWTLHKGWDVLLRAFLEEFKGRTDVHLILKVWSTNGYSEDQIREQAYEFSRRELGIDLVTEKNVRFVFDRFSTEGLVSLYRSVDAYVMPSRGEGWGRPYMEAMACGLPTIGTGWSGNTAYMNAENSYLVDCDIVPVPEAGWREVQNYKGHRWAEPDSESLRRIMRYVLEHREEVRAVGDAAREHVLANFSREATGPLLYEALATALHRRAVDSTVLVATSLSENHEEDAHADVAPVRVRWEGPQLRWHSLAHVNREFGIGLLQAGSVELSLIPTEPSEFTPSDAPQFAALAARTFAPLSGSADVHVRHHFPPRFDRPDTGRLVLIQPWEYGYLPKEWIEPIRTNCDEVWCHTRYVMDVYRNSSIPENKLKLVPLGVDTQVFRPDAPPYVFTTEAGADRMPKARNGSRPFTFLYTGGTIYRKGIDILLDAYLRAFSAADDVCLVVKDTGTSTVYPDNAGERIKGLIDDPSRPRIVYLDDNLTAHQLAGIYTACDSIVQPYRGEGFCLPVLEAMACGIPAIVPAGGPTDDFVDETVGYRIEADLKPMPETKIGPWECVEQPWMFEVDPVALADLMRSVRENPSEAERRGALAAERAREEWTWKHASAIAMDRLLALKASEAPEMMIHKPTKPAARLHWSVSDNQSRAANTESAAEASSSSRLPELREPDALVRDSVTNERISSAIQPTISLCMIVRNEERVLGDCLASIKPWVDEVIVVDTGSDDRTPEIAQEHGAKVFRFPWTDSFSEARNVSISHATCDWILWMDADDTIPEHCGRRLHDLVLMASDTTTGILMQVHIPPAEGEHGFTIVDHVKLFRNRLGLQFEGRIHEQILEPIYRIGGTVERSDLYVVHSGYDYSPEGQKKKRARDLSLLEKDLADRPDHPFVLFNIGMTAFHMKDFDKAIPALERSLSLSKPHESTVRKLYAMLAGCALETHDFMGAKRWIEQGLSIYPKDPELLFRAGIIYREVGDLAKAEQSYLKLLNEREVGHIDSLDVTMAGYKAHHNLALVYLDLGRPTDAETELIRATQLQPSFVPSLVALEDIYVRTNNVSGKQRVADALRQLGCSPAQCS